MSDYVPPMPGEEWRAYDYEEDEYTNCAECGCYIYRCEIDDYYHTGEP